MHSYLHISCYLIRCGYSCTLIFIDYEYKPLGVLTAIIHIAITYLHIRILPSVLIPIVASEPTSLALVQEGPTSVRVSWSPPSPLGDTTGYRISYSGSSSGGSSGSVDVSDGSTSTHTLTGLQNGDSYAISIVGTSQHFFSNSVTTSDNIMLGKYIYVRYSLIVSIWFFFP